MVKKKKTMGLGQVKTLLNLKHLILCICIHAHLALAHVSKWLMYFVCSCVLSIFHRKANFAKREILKWENLIKVNERRRRTKKENEKKKKTLLYNIHTHIVIYYLQSDRQFCLCCCVRWEDWLTDSLCSLFYLLYVYNERTLCVYTYSIWGKQKKNVWKKDVCAFDCFHMYILLLDIYVQSIWQEDRGMWSKERQESQGNFLHSKHTKTECFNGRKKVRGDTANEFQAEILILKSRVIFVYCIFILHL